MLFTRSEQRPSRADVQSVQDNLPAASLWVIDKINGVDGVFDDCDTNRDDVFT